jgi:hypothetical protein
MRTRSRPLESFNCAIFDERETELIGCIYIDPTGLPDTDAEISLVGPRLERRLRERLRGATQCMRLGGAGDSLLSLVAVQFAIRAIHVSEPGLKVREPNEVAAAGNGEQRGARLGEPGLSVFVVVLDRMESVVADVAEEMCLVTLGRFSEPARKPRSRPPPRLICSTESGSRT